MTDAIPPQGPLRGVPSAQPIGGGSSARAPSAAGSVGSPSSAGAPSFRAMLEKLEKSAASLEQKSRAELGREELSDAVDEARASMQDVLSIQQRLLEAVRFARHGGDSSSGTGPIQDPARGPAKSDGGAT